MSKFDIGTGIIASTANKFLSTIHSKFHKDIFTGELSTTIDLVVDEVKVGVNWDVVEAPSLSFTPLPKNELQTIVEEQIEEHGIPKKMEANKNELINSLVNSIITSSFILSLPKIAVKISEPTGTLPSELEVGVNVLVNLQFENSKLSIKPIKATATSSTQAIEAFLNKVLLPTMLNVVSSLPAIEIPPINIEGLSLTPPIPYITEGRAIGLTNDLSHGMPTLPSGFTLPNSPFFLLLNPDFIVEIANKNLAGFTHELINKKVDPSIMVASVKIQLKVALNNFSISKGSSPLEFNFSTNLFGKGVSNAWTFPMPWPIGVNYKISNNGLITGNVKLNIQNNKVSVSVNRVDNINISLTAAGGVAEWITSLITGPLVGFVSNMIISILKGFIDKNFDLFEIPKISIPIANETITVKPEGVNLNPHSDYASIEGGLSFN